MKQFIQLGATQIGAAIQNISEKVDFEIVSLPGGSLVAVLLSLYAIAMGSIRRAATRNRVSTGKTEMRRCAVHDSRTICTREGAVVTYYSIRKERGRTLPRPAGRDSTSRCGGRSCRTPKTIGLG